VGTICAPHPAAAPNAERFRRNHAVRIRYRNPLPMRL